QMSFSSTPTSGNLLIAVASTRTATGLTMASAGWSEAINQGATGSTPGQAIFYKVAGASEPVLVTVNLTGGSNSANALQLYEYSGLTVNQALVLDTTGSDVCTLGGTCPLTVNSGSLTTTANNDLILAAVIDNQGSSLTGWSNSFVQVSNFKTGSGG